MRASDTSDTLEASPSPSLHFTSLHAHPRGASGCRVQELGLEEEAIVARVSSVEGRVSALEAENAQLQAQNAELKAQLMALRDSVLGTGEEPKGSPRLDPEA